MKIKTQIAKLTVQMNTNEITVGEFLLSIVRLSEKYNSHFSKEFLEATRKEGNRLITYRANDIIDEKFLSKTFGEK